MNPNIMFLVKNEVLQYYLWLKIGEYDNHDYGVLHMLSVGVHMFRSEAPLELGKGLVGSF